jgi:CRISPR-associated Csx14 family protein
MSEEKISENKYDVFLCYNREDEFSVKEIGKQLKGRGIAPWLDVWEVRPGTLWLREKAQQIKRIQSAAVFVGASGINPSEQLIEIDALLREFMRREVPVIPVLLEDAPDKLELPLLLDGMRQVDFRTLKENRTLAPEEDPLNLLIWGITKQRVWKNQQSVLIASLGESPVVVSAMYDLLTQKEGLTIDQVIVLHPEGKDIERAYDLVKKALASRCKLRREILPFKDANSRRDASIYLKELYVLLDTCQVRGDNVCLSLAGGRKSMAALMAWIVPFFSCVKHLYHVIDPDEEHFLSINELELDLTPSQRELAMHPDLKPLIPVNIPYEKGQQIDLQNISYLLSASEEELEKLQEEEMEKAGFLQGIIYEGRILEAMVTERVMAQFRLLCQQDRDAARRVRDCLERMQFTAELRNLKPDSFPFPYTPPKPAIRTQVDLHSFTGFETAVHPIFYTLPKDIYGAWDDEVEQVVICELDTDEYGRYRNLQEIVASPDFSIKKAYPLEKLPPVPARVKLDSVLIVPLGKFPMVATQLYTLLVHEEAHNIREVILVYPAQATEIVNGADLVEHALHEEANVPCIHVPILDLKDIDSPDACQEYQATLEEAIEQARKDHPVCTIDLALSGGRKGMTAMTIFAAQKKGLSYVYHTLITDKQLNEDIDKQTTVEKLTDLHRDERNDCLFLRAYEGNGPYTKFVLFKVPVLPAKG